MGPGIDALEARSHMLEPAISIIWNNRFRMCMATNIWYPPIKGRAAEHIISKILIKPGDYIPGNMYFTTTKLHQELAGGKFVDVIIDEAHDPESEHPFKGNIDLNKLQALIDEVGAEKIPYVSVATTVNMAGGQPISLKNMKAVRELTQKYGIQIVHDMTRVAENAYMIQQNEPGYANKTVAEIVKEINSLTDHRYHEC